MKLLKNLCEISAPSGNERPLRDFLINYIKKAQKDWRNVPELIYGDDFMDCLLVKFGNPRVAVFAHMDSVGFTVRYRNQLVPIGQPDIASGYNLVGQDRLGPVECTLQVDENHQLFYEFGRAIESGTDLVFKSNFRMEGELIKSPYLDNRLGIYNVLKLAEELEDGILVFSTWEEHGGGSVPFLIKYLYEKFRITKALISDITWITEGIHPGNGVVISMRDYNIPRKIFLKQIIDLARESGIDFQIEVEGSGSSDGREIQLSPYPVDWCFIGAAEDNVHSPDEEVHQYDIVSMLAMYKFLLKNL